MICASSSALLPLMTSSRPLVRSWPRGSSPCPYSRGAVLWCFLAWRTGVRRTSTWSAAWMQVSSARPSPFSPALVEAIADLALDLAGSLLTELGMPELVRRNPATAFDKPVTRPGCLATDLQQSAARRWVTVGKVLGGPLSRRRRNRKSSATTRRAKAVLEELQALNARDGSLDDLVARVEDIHRALARGGRPAAGALEGVGRAWADRRTDWDHPLLDKLSALERSLNAGD